MNPFNKIIERLERLKKESNRIIKESLEESSGKVVRLNQEQLDEGLYKDGTKITPEYTEFTKRIKREFGQPTDRVTLKFTGKFRRQMKLVSFNNKAKVFSTDSKLEKLKNKYNKGDKDFFGLTVESKQTLKNKSLLSKIQSKSREILT